LAAITIHGGEAVLDQKITVITYPVNINDG
jgi:hypothetical protein